MSPQTTALCPKRRLTFTEEYTFTPMHKKVWNIWVTKLCSGRRYELLKNLICNRNGQTVFHPAQLQIWWKGFFLHTFSLKHKHPATQLNAIYMCPSLCVFVWTFKLWYTLLSPRAKSLLVARFSCWQHRDADPNQTLSCDPTHPDSPTDLYPPSSNKQELYCNAEGQEYINEGKGSGIQNPNHQGSLLIVKP